MEGTNIYSVKDTIYNSQGQVWKESLPYESSGASRTVATTTSSLFTTYTYDALSRPATTTNNLGSTSNTYDQWTTTTTDPASKIKDYVTDARGNLTQVVEHVATSSYTTTYEWNLNGLLTKITDALGNVRNFGYNGVGNRTSAEDLHASGDATFGEWAFQYDSAGNLATSGSPINDIVVYTYDALNRVTKENWTSGAGNEITYTYDSCTAGVGYLCSAIVTGSATTSYTYAPTGKVKEETVLVSATSTSFVTTTGYDRQGNIAQIILPDSSRIRYNYNAAGLAETVERRQASTWYDVITDIDYAPTDQVTYLAYTNGVSTTNTYDPTKLYRLTNKTTAKSGGSTFQDIDYTYDAVGNITTLEETASSSAKRVVSYTYDDLHRLTNATATKDGGALYTRTFSYSAIGNITNKSDVGNYVYNGSAGSNYENPHAPTKVNNINQNHDRNGNLLTDGTRTNTWNYKNQLTQVVSGSATSTFTYDYSGNRLTLTTSSTATIYPNKNYDVRGNIKNRNIYLGEQLLATIEDISGTITPHFVHNDHLNGSSVITSNTGTQDQIIDYYPFGTNRIDEKAGSFDQKRKFIGERFDSDSEYSYLNARYYQSGNGRFISQDPVFISLGTSNSNEIGQKEVDILKNPQSLNSYSYAINNPMRFVDPLGLFKKKTGEVEKGDTLNDITDIINEMSGTNYSVDQIASLNNISNINHIEIGQTLVPNESFPDRSNQLLSMSSQHSKDWKINNPLYFKKMVNDRGPWDLKYDPDFDSSKYKGFVFNGEKIDFDAPANIHYGYVGSSTWWGSTKFLLKQAGKNQVEKGASNSDWIDCCFGDDPRDTLNILKGINLYENK